MIGYIKQVLSTFSDLIEDPRVAAFGKTYVLHLVIQNTADPKTRVKLVIDKYDELRSSEEFGNVTVSQLKKAVVGYTDPENRLRLLTDGSAP